MKLSPESAVMYELGQREQSLAISLIKPCETNDTSPCGEGVFTPKCHRNCENPSYNVPYEKVEIYSVLMGDLCNILPG